MTASAAECRTQINNAVAIFHAIYTAIESGTSLVGLVDSYVQALETATPGIAAQFPSSMRSNLAALISPSVVAAAFAPHLEDYAAVLAVPYEGPEAFIGRLYRYMYDNSEDVNGRGISFGTPAAASANVGTGTMYRVTTDAYGFPIESGILATEAFEAYCDVDQLGTSRHEESFTLRGGPASPDGLERKGSGLVTTIRSLSCRDSLLQNAGFADGTSGSDITSWTVASGSVANTALDTTNVYRGAEGITATSLRLNTSTISLQQKIHTIGIDFDPSVPYMYRIAWNRSVGTGAGTLAIALGSKSNSVVASAQSGWQLLLVVATPGQNNWSRNFYEDDLDITITWTYTSGYVLIADAILAPFQRLGNGSFAQVIGGATPFAVGDKFTWTDTIASDSKVQFWLQRGFPGLYLPSQSDASETWTDPS